MTSPARPKSRMSINPAGVGLVERDLNHGKGKGKKRAVMSMGGGGNGKSLDDKTLSPKSQARRTAKPRKSILKAFTIPSFGGQNENENEDEVTAQYGEDGMAHTINFSAGGRPSISSRRVAFAPSAHVRMFEKPDTTSRRRSSVAPSSAIPGQANTFTLPPPTSTSHAGPLRTSTGHGRRSSIQNIAAVGADIGEGSMDMSLEESDDRVEVQQYTLARDDEETEDEDEDDMSMEMTQSYGGGIIQQHQQQQEEGDGEESFMTETSTRSDEEKTMEFTIAIGGFLPPQPPTGAKKGRASVGYTHIGPEGALIPGEGEDEDEGDMEMDETVAFGGIVANAYTADDTISTNGSDGDDTLQGREKERTMTFNFGDLRSAAIQEQATMDMEVELDMDMDMTTVGGGIHTHQHSHLHAHTSLHTQTPNIFAQPPSQTQPQIQPSTTPKSPRTLTKPTSSTPSFARPTASSAQKAVSILKSPEKEKEKEKVKQRRNIFGPSPSPAKSLITPRKSGMGMSIAGEVAKRLSFGSVVSGGGSVNGKRRADEDEDEEEDEGGKRQRVGLGDSIFGRPRLSASGPSEPPARGTPRKSLAPESTSSNKGTGTPRKSMAPVQQSPGRPTPRKSIVGSSTPAKSPRRSLFPTVVQAEPDFEAEADLADEDVRAEEDNEEMEMEMEMEEISERREEFQAPAIGLASFLQMAGVEFVDTLPSMGRRKSGTGRGLGEGVRDRVFDPCDYTEAKIESIFLHTYNWATTKVRSDLIQTRSELEYSTTPFNTHNPPVISEYLEASDEERKDFESIFRAFKINTQLQARGRWYVWKRGLMERLRPDIEGILGEVEEDETTLDAMTSEIDEYLPLLRERAAALQVELSRERDVVSEIESCDQGDLSDWKATVVDTKKALDEQISETSDLTSKLADLNSKLADYESTINDHVVAIKGAKSMCDEFTKGDVGRLQREYETLQYLHQWEINHLRSDEFSLTYSGEIRLSFNCNAFIPDLSSASISLLNSGKGPTAAPTGGLFGLLETQLSQILRGKKLSLSIIVQRVGNLWNSAQRLRSEFQLLSQQYPTTYSLSSTSKCQLQCATIIMLPMKKGKIVLEFGVGAEVLGNWPVGLAGVETGVRVVYGDELDLSLLKMAAEETIATVQESGYVGILLNVARDVAQQYA